MRSVSTFALPATVVPDYYDCHVCVSGSLRGPRYSVLRGSRTGAEPQPGHVAPRVNRELDHERMPRAPSNSSVAAISLMPRL